ncbi:MAG: hypothetical protein KH354_05560, partial [Clostridiales bacterium]|nr:hypothetical protein [Clostridiales bacterium]
MKRALTFTVVFMLVLMFLALPFAPNTKQKGLAGINVAFAAPAEEVISVKGGTVTVNVIDDFSAHSANDNYGNEGYWTFGFDGSKMTINMTGYSDVLYHMQANEGPAIPSTAATEALWASAKYAGYQIQNGSSQDIALALESTLSNGNAWGALMQSHNTAEEMAAAPVVLLSKKDGKINAAETALKNYRGQGAIIPAGFDGWIFFPIERMNDVGANAYFTNISFYMECAAEAFTLTVDNLALAESLDVTPDGSDEAVLTGTGMELIVGVDEFGRKVSAVGAQREKKAVGMF